MVSQSFGSRSKLVNQKLYLLKYHYITTHLLSPTVILEESLSLSLNVFEIQALFNFSYLNKGIAKLLSIYIV